MSMAPASRPLARLATLGPQRTALQGVTPADVVQRLPEVKIEEARRIVSSIYRGGVLGSPVATVRRVSIEAVAAHYHVPALEVKSVRHSALDPFVKWLLSTADDKLIETVRIPLEREGRFTACVSSQVGCALGCTFCATGRMGLRRNLEAWEIVEQVRLIRGSITPGSGRVHGVVFQGMGEAMANLDRVLAAMAVLSEPSAMAIDQRTITVCTSGLPSGIRRLAQAAPRARLALSIGSARPSVRRRIMPIDDAHPLAEVVQASIEHAQHTGIAPMWALTLLGGVNDSDEDAHALGALARDFRERCGVRPRLTLIAYNSPAEGDADPFVRATPEREAAMRSILAEYSVFPHRRYSGGSDVGAACGQLAATA